MTGRRWARKFLPHDIEPHKTPNTVNWRHFPHLPFREPAIFRQNKSDGKTLPTRLGRGFRLVRNFRREDNLKRLLSLPFIVWTWVIEKFASIVVVLATGSQTRIFRRGLSRGTLPRGVVFVPYNSPACRLLYRAVALLLKRKGLSTSSTDSSLGSSATWAWDAAESHKRQDGEHFRSFTEMTEYLEALGEKSPRLARGIIDEFIRTTPLSTFEGGYFVPDEFAEMVAAKVLLAESLVSQSSCVILPDSAYITHSAIISFCEIQNKPCWVLNPAGHFFRIDNGPDEITRASSLESAREIQNLEPKRQAVANQFFESRMARNAPRDQDSLLAFAGEDRLPPEWHNRKILFLHAFRDANLFPLYTDEGKEASAFRTYFEWADFALSVVRESPNDWLIRPHPRRSDYHSDIDILSVLLRKHSVEDVPLLTGVSTSAILRARSCVFTHMGTIAIETAALGYKVHAASSAYPSAIASSSIAKEEVRSAMLSACGSSLDSDVHPRDMGAAKIMLLRRLAGPDHNLQPSRALDRTSPSRLELSKTRQSVDITRLMVSKGATGALGRIAANIDKSVQPSD